MAKLKMKTRILLQSRKYDSLRNSEEKKRIAHIKLILIFKIDPVYYIAISMS